MAQTKKIDRRIARTRRALQNAVIELAFESGYDQITIRDLTERADIGYATFYRHYKSKDELLTSHIGALLLEIANEIKSPKSDRGQYVELFNIIARYKDALLIGFSLPRDHQAMIPLWQKVFDMTSDLYLARDESVIPLKVSLNHMIRSFCELTHWWLTEGQAYNPEQMARMLSELIMSVAEQVAVVPRDAENRDDEASQREREISATDAPPRIPN